MEIAPGVLLDMRRARIALLFGMLPWVAFGGAVTNAERSVPRLRAFASLSDVYVDFAFAAPIVDGLDAGFLELNQTVVKWEIDLRSARRGETNSVPFVIARTVRRSTLEVFVSPSKAPGTCETSRQLNGRWLESRRVLSCTDAYRAISSFDVPAFTLTGVTPGSFDVTIRATVTGGRSVKVKTPVLARTRLIQPINPQQ
jgi:hypothetical protein